MTHIPDAVVLADLEMVLKPLGISRLLYMVSPEEKAAAILAMQRILISHSAHDEESTNRLRHKLLVAEGAVEICQGEAILAVRRAVQFEELYTRLLNKLNTMGDNP